MVSKSAEEILFIIFIVSLYILENPLNIYNYNFRIQEQQQNKVFETFAQPLPMILAGVTCKHPRVKVRTECSYSSDTILAVSTFL